MEHTSTPGPAKLPEQICKAIVEGIIFGQLYRSIALSIKNYEKLGSTACNPPKCFLSSFIRHSMLYIIQVPFLLLEHSSLRMALLLSLHRTLLMALLLSVHTSLQVGFFLSLVHGSPEKATHFIQSKPLICSETKSSNPYNFQRLASTHQLLML